MEVYLSYVFQDIHYFRIENMVYVIENNNIAEKVYFWERDNIPGVPFLNYIETQIYNSDVVLILFSANSKNSSCLKQELAMALSMQKKIIPIYDNYDNIPLSLSGRKNFQYDEHEYYDFMHRLCKYLSGLIYDDEYDNFAHIETTRNNKIKININNNTNNVYINQKPKY